MHLLVVLFLAVAVILQQTIVFGGELLKTPKANDVPEVGVRSSWDATIEPAASSFGTGPNRFERAVLPGIPGFPGYPGYPGFPDNPGFPHPPPQCIPQCQPGPWPPFPPLPPQPVPTPPTFWPSPPQRSSRIFSTVNCDLCRLACPPLQFPPPSPDPDFTPEWLSPSPIQMFRSASLHPRKRYARSSRNHQLNGDGLTGRSPSTSQEEGSGRFE